MELAGIIIGIVVAVALGTYIRNRRRGEAIKPMQVVSIAAAAAIGSGIVSLGWTFLKPRLDATDQATSVERALQSIRDMPLIGLLVAENPEIQTRFRKALEEQAKDPQGGSRKLFELGAEVRQQYIIPVLRNASDAAALKAAASLSEFSFHLQQTSPLLCQQFGATGIQHPEKLDAESTAMFRRALAAQEEAYRSGKGQTTTRPATSDQELGRVLSEAGYKEADLEKLVQFNTLAAPEACAATVKLYAAPALLPVPRGAILARYLLTIPQ